MSKFHWTHRRIWAAQCLRTLGGHWHRADKNPLHRLLSVHGYMDWDSLFELERGGFAEQRTRKRWWGGKYTEWRLTADGLRATMPVKQEKLQ